MTDFLTSLTARSFGRETAIRPRVASLFEPVRNGDAAFREAPAAEPVETAIAREVEVESDGERKMNHPAPALQEDCKVSDAKHSADESRVGAIIPQPRGDSERRRTTVLADEPKEKEDKVVAAKVRPRKALLSQAENANESEPALRSDSEDVAPKRVPARAPVVSPTRDELEEGHRGLLLPPKVATALTTQMKNAAMALNAGLSAPKREKAGIASPALAAEPEPSVHVTIGRIEVRATSESKPVGRPRAASPVMSLEEYLHRRTQRGGQ